MKIVCISDTHLAEPELPKGDVLVHSGDFTYRGRPHEIAQQLYWLSQHRHKYDHVVCTPGNHDFGFESNYHQYRLEAENKGITFLNDAEIILDGIKFWGSPISPFFHNWAFNRHPADIEFHWDLIPDDVNVLITHGPAYGILDGVPRGGKTLIGYDEHYRPMYKKDTVSVEHVGCPELLERIKARKQLKLHVFGHIHEGYGQEEHFGVKFVNASIMDGDYKPVNKPIIVEI
jgi:Icc-related predicted phosphoesterase